MHVAIIMDGNGRWAERRGLSRSAGHRAGARAVREAVQSAARDPAVGALTLYAFSSDNWRRPPDEVTALMRLFARFLATEGPRCAEHGVRVSVIGRRDRLAAPLVSAIDQAEAATADGSALHLRIAVDYSSRWAIESGCRLPDVDLLIRTGGERRLSDFLLWECAYAELVFLDRLWPDFTAADFASALREFGLRERRFGGLRKAAAQ
jgi:undecaprenyl diphosphate synthase